MQKEIKATEPHPAWFDDVFDPIIVKALREGPKRLIMPFNPTGTGAALCCDFNDEKHYVKLHELPEPTLKDKRIDDASVEELLFAVREKTKEK